MTDIKQIPTTQTVHKATSIELYEPLAMIPTRNQILPRSLRKNYKPKRQCKEINYISTPSGLSAINVKENELEKSITYTKTIWVQYVP